MRVANWPIYELMHAAQSVLIKAALESYRHDMIVWASLAPHTKQKSKAPMKPEILK